MILKLILIGIVLVAIYRFLGGSTSLPSSKNKEKDTEDADTLEECPTCGVFVTRKESIHIKGKYYCSKKCLP